MSEQIVIGIDTRLLIADLKGTIRSYIEKSGTNPYHQEAGDHLC
jgi:hypothetical protein